VARVALEPVAERRGERAGAGRAPRAAGDPRLLAAAIGNRRFGRLARAAAAAPAPRPITIGPAEDVSEREADGVARGVERPTARRAATPAPRSARRAPASVAETLASPGRPLDARARRHFEARLGADLGAVRIHDGPRAAQSAADVSALAYAVGTDVVLARAYRHYDPVDRSVLAHELAHVVQHPDGRVLRRFTSCGRLLTGRDPRARRTGPRVSEAAVQEFLAEELEPTGDVVREFPVRGATAAPWRTDGPDDTVIDPQVIDSSISGFVDIAYHDYGRELEFLEVKEADWGKAVFAEQQLTNYIAWADQDIRGTLRRWQTRGHPHAYFDEVADMPTTRYTPPEQAVDIDGYQVALAWCRPGVIVFKTLDVDNEELNYCGISDKGHTDAFIDRVLGQAEEIVAHAMARRMADIGVPVVNFKLFLDAVRKRLRSSIRWAVEQAIKKVCEAVLEVTMAAVLDQLRRFLRNRDLLDAFIVNFSPAGETVDLPIGESARRTASVLTLAVVIDAALTALALAL
jgi:Domain of unknown function (DUF4157)